MSKKKKLKKVTSVTEYTDGSKTETMTFYYPNGKIKSIVEREFDEKTGKIKQYPITTSTYFYDEKGRLVKIEEDQDEGGRGLKTTITFNPITGEETSRLPGPYAETWH